MTQHNRIELLQEYKNGSSVLREALTKLPAEILKYKPGPNRWSVHEIVIHLADSEVQSHVRCRMILAEPGTMIVNHEEHQWSVALNYPERDLDEALDMISLVRSANFNLLQSVPESSWQNYCVHSVRGNVTLDDWLRTYVNHIPHHIGQMQRNYQEWSALRA